MSKRNKRKLDDAERQTIETQVRSALAGLGWMPPTTEAEVAAVEAELPDTQLPDSLADADAILGRPDRSIGAPEALKLPGSSDIESTLRRAAREGGTIPPEIEEKMRRDREQAKKEMDEDADGQDSH